MWNAKKNSTIYSGCYLDSITTNYPFTHNLNKQTNNIMVGNLNNELGLVLYILTYLYIVLPSEWNTNFPPWSYLFSFFYAFSIERAHSTTRNNIFVS